MAGKFDPTGATWSSTRSYQAFRALGRLLLAEPDEELAEVRERILAAVGPNAGLLTAAVPEFAALLAVPPDPGDPLTAQVRAQRAVVAVLRAVASRKRPLVMFLDDLQWAGRTPARRRRPGAERGAGRGPAAGGRLPRRRRGRGASAGGAAVPVARPGRRCGTCGWPTCRRPSLAAMVAEMLHVDRAAAAAWPR